MKYVKSNEDLVNWMRVMRVSQGFFFISAMPVILGSALVLQHGGIVKPTLFFLIIIGALVYHLGADMINEYYDHISGNDSFVEMKTPFSGGTGVLEDGLLAPKKVLNMSYLFFISGLLLSLLTAYLSTPKLLIFSALGFFSCWGYTAPPLKFCYRGFGELIIFLNNGPFLVGAVCLAMTGELFLELLLPSFFLGFLGVAIIIMNEIPDINADKKANKKNLVVRFGVKRALKIHKLAMFFSYLSLISAVSLGHLPVWCLAGLLGPLTVSDKSIFNVQNKDVSEVIKMTSLCKSTILLKFRSWAFVMIGFAIAFFV